MAASRTSDGSSSGVRAWVDSKEDRASTLGADGGGANGTGATRVLSLAGAGMPGWPDAWAAETSPTADSIA